jgi:hypothetical protein
MPDISMCIGGTCSIKNTCYRFTAKPGHWQTYFSDPPMEPDGNCRYYMVVYPVQKEEVKENDLA